MNARATIVAVALVGALLPAPALALGGTGSISGTVYDANGLPAADIYVSACTNTCDYAFTAANGTYAIPGLAAGSYRLGIEDYAGVVAGGFATGTGLTTNVAAAALITVGATPVTFDIHATAGHTINGTITAQAGGPAANVFVEACLVTAPGIDRTFVPCGFDTTAADGTYSLAVLPGRYRVYAYGATSGYASGYYAAAGYVMSSRLATLVTVSATDVSGISMALPAGAAIAGTVRDNLGAPVEGMTAEACPTTDLQACVFDITAADGSYSVGGLPVGTYEMIFKHSLATQPGGYYGTAGFTAESAQASSIAVGASGVTGIDVKLPVGRIVSGVITDASGRPASVEVSDCTVKVCMYVTTTAGDGTYRINLAPGKHDIHLADETGANLSGFYSTAGLANGSHSTQLTVGASDLSGINVKLRRIVGSIHAGTAHSGKYASSAVVVKGTYATARFNLGKTFTGTKVSILRAVKSSTGTWSTYRKVATVVVASDGYAYYSAKISGSFGFRASQSDALVPGVQVLSAPVFVRSK